MYSSRCLARFGDVICTVALFRKKSTAGSLCGNGTVAKRPRLSHEARGRSGGRVDDVEAVQSHEDAIASTTSSSSSFFTLSQYHHHVRAELEQAAEHVMQPLARGHMTRGISRIRRRVDVGPRVDQSF